MRVAIDQIEDAVQDVTEGWVSYAANVVPVPIVRDTSPEMGGAVPASVFKDVNALKNGLNTEDQEAKERAKYHNGIFGRLATNKKFEAITIVVITMNALEIGWDTDYSARFGKPENLYEGPAGFIIFENLFAVYFTLEILVRVLAYKHKITMLKDGWFIFDFLLVSLMVAETWILAFLGGSPMGQLSILRLLRLLRITRMAKLMRAVPELMMIVKGITAATRAVIWTAVLLFVITYTWAILLTNEYHQGSKLDDEVEEEAEQLFGSMGKSFSSLLVMGTILDDVTYATDVIRGTDNLPILCAFVVYIIINSFTMLNMLVGILVEVVSSTKEGEGVRQLENQVRGSVRELFDSLDKDGSGRISRKEFLGLRGFESLLKALQELGIRDTHFDMYGEILFEESSLVDYETMIEVILRLRPSENMSSLDFNAFEANVRGARAAVSKRVDRLERLTDELQRVFGLHKNKPSTDSPTRIAPYEGRRQAPRQPLINLDMMSQLEFTPYVDILNELQRRLGMPNFEEAGVPMDLLDDDLRTRICMHSDFMPLELTPVADPEWSEQTYVC